jgi:hypothetical protein
LRDLLNALGDAPAVDRPEVFDGLENKQVEGALEDVCFVFGQGELLLEIYKTIAKLL